MDTYDRIFTHCHISTHPGHYVRGHRIAEGLAIADLADTPHDEARWSITHTQSGRAILFACCEDHARRLATALTSLHIDWTRNEDDLRDDEDQLRQAIESTGLVVSVTNLCDDHPYGVLSC